MLKSLYILVNTCIILPSNFCQSDVTELQNDNAILHWIFLVLNKVGISPHT